MMRKRTALVVASGGVTMALVVAAYTSWPRTSDGTREATRPDWVELYPSWSPDGRRIAFIRGPELGCGGEIYVVNARAGKPRQITTLSDSELGAGARNPAWSPDGKKIAFSVASSTVGSVCGEDEIDVISAEGGGHATLRMPTTFGQKFSTYRGCPSWSPDSRWIVFPRVDNVVVVKEDGTARRRLATSASPSDCPVWSPHGRRIVFVKDEVYLAELDGGKKRLTRTRGTAYSPAWAPDGSQVAFLTADEADKFSIRTVRSNGGAQTRIAVEGAGWLDNLTWAPDGGRMAFIKYDGNVGAQLVVISADGSDRHALHIPEGGYQPELGTWLGEEAPICCPAWSPDGRKLAFVKSGRIYIVRTDQVGLTGSLRRVVKGH